MLQTAYTKFTHFVAGLLGLFAGFYGVSADFRTWIGQLLAAYQSHVSPLLQPIPPLAVALWFWYRNGSAGDSPAAPKSSQGQAGFARIAFLQVFVPAVLTFSLIMQVVIVAGCAKVQQDLQTVLKKAPTVIAIVKTGIDLASVVDPGLVDPGFKPLIAGIADEVTTDLQLVVDGIGQYQSNIASAPPGAIAKARALYSVIDGKLAQFEQAFHLKGQRTEAEAQAIVDAADIFLSELGSLLPPAPVTVVAQATPRTQAAIVGVKVTIVSARQFARNFNAASAANFPNSPQFQVPVP